MVCWETFGLGIRVEITLTPTTSLNIVADLVHPFMATVLPNGSGILQQDNAPCHTVNIVQECLRNKTKSCRAVDVLRSQSDHATVGCAE